MASQKRSLCSSAFGEVIGALARLQTEKQLSDAVPRTLPVLTAGASSVLLRTLEGNNPIIEARLEANRGLSAGDSLQGQGHVWARPFGAWADQDERRALPGYDQNTYGLALGADANLSASTLLGYA